MVVANLFRMGFMATGLSTRPVESSLLCIIAYAIFNQGTFHSALAAFMGALAAAFLGSTQNWQPVSMWNLRFVGLMGCYVFQLLAPNNQIWLCGAYLYELSLLPQDVFFQGAAAHIAMLVFGALLAATVDQQVFCCIPVIAICALVAHGRSAMNWIHSYSVSTQELHPSSPIGTLFLS
jgi:hypothetical protein